MVRHADELSVRGLARAIGELAEKARTGDLTPDDLSGKTFTISNPRPQGQPGRRRDHLAAERRHPAHGRDQEARRRPRAGRDRTSWRSTP
ncbi:MAG: 2-oxo acid dehydrogenase subunit E2 [Sandaracinaceae bacterium]|nr:2-oxo acid dehydrogenase subunit E2 [Sandaracinaceae bacterium]